MGFSSCHSAKLVIGRPKYIFLNTKWSDSVSKSLKVPENLLNMPI